MLILLCKYALETYVLPVSETDCFRFVEEKIRQKWPCLNGLSLKLYYKLPGCSRCLLSGDEDLVSLFIVSRTCTTGPSIHVDVVEDYNNHSSSSSGCVARVDDVVSSTSNSTSNSYMGGDVVGDDDLVSVSTSRNQTLVDKARLDLGWGSISFKCGAVFYGGASDFRLSLQKLSIHTGFQYVLKKNESTRILALCRFKDSHGCGWKVYGIKSHVNGFFYVKDSCIVHICGCAGRSFDGSRLSSELVAHVIESMVRDTPNLSPGVVKRNLFSLFSFRVSYYKARLGVSKAQSALFGDVRESFMRLPAYVQCLLDSNPDSRIFYELYPESNRFRRMFVAFHGCIRGFNYCRPLLFLDGAHLKGQFRGHLLGATGKDGNQGLYPLCFAIVDSEDIDNWAWFLTNLKAILAPERRITFITDRHAGLIDGIRTIFPDAYHSYCLYHLKLNLREKFASASKDKFLRNRMVELLDLCAYAATELEFATHFNSMILEGGECAKGFFKDLNHENWANAHFKGCRYGYITSSTAESFNAWVLKERHLPIVNLVDAIRVKLMQRLSDKRNLASSWNSAICPIIDSSLSCMMAQSKQWNVVSSTYFVYEVQSSPSASVNLSARTCSCNLWQIFGYPCRHAVAVVMTTHLCLSDYVDVCYLSSSFVDCYQHAIYPVLDTYLTAVISPASILLPPFSRRQPGRPRTRRIRSRGEPSKRSKGPYRCSRCGSYSRHNKSTCTAPVQLD